MRGNRREGGGEIGRRGGREGERNKRGEEGKGGEGEKGRQREGGIDGKREIVDQITAHSRTCSQLTDSH